MTYNYKQLFTFDQIDKLYNDGAIIDAKEGGLLIGPSHDLGGIYFLFEYADGFRLYGEVEGYEYIINRDVAIKYNDLVGKINHYESDFYNNFMDYNIPNNVKLIDATSPDYKKYKSKFLILDVRGGFAIINKYSTKKHLKNIDLLNGIKSSSYWDLFKIFLLSKKFRV